MAASSAFRFELLLALVMAVALLTIPSGMLDVAGAMVASFGGVTTLVVASLVRQRWRPSVVVIFLALLILFQLGTVIAYFLGVEMDFTEVTLAVSSPISVNPEAVTTAAAGVLAAGYFVYLGYFLWRPTSVVGLGEANTDVSLGDVATLLFWLSFPLSLYKTAFYFHYVMTNGGYLAIYTGVGEHLEAIGLLPRVGAMLTLASFLVAFYALPLGPRLRKVVWGQAALVLIELFIGLRGKALSFFVLLWFALLSKHKRRLSIVAMSVSVVVIAAVAVAVAVFRENQDGLVDFFLSNFFQTQGVSFQLLSLSAQFENSFSPNAIAYVLNTLVVPFKHVYSFGPNQLLTVDMTTFLNQSAFDMGFGTGSSYLAEAYLLGGGVAIAASSFAIGLVLRACETCTDVWRKAGAFVMLWFLVYLPRSGLLEPIGNTVKLLPAFALVYLAHRYLAAPSAVPPARSNQAGHRALQAVLGPRPIKLGGAALERFAQEHEQDG
jgi:hypothetical protein